MKLKNYFQNGGGETVLTFFWIFMLQNLRREMGLEIACKGIIGHLCSDGSSKK